MNAAGSIFASRPGRERTGSFGADGRKERTFAAPIDPAASNLNRSVTAYPRTPGADVRTHARPKATRLIAVIPKL